MSREDRTARKPRGARSRPRPDRRRRTHVRVLAGVAITASLTVGLIAAAVMAGPTVPTHRVGLSDAVRFAQDDGASAALLDDTARTVELTVADGQRAAAYDLAVAAAVDRGEEPPGRPAADVDYRLVAGWPEGYAERLTADLIAAGVAVDADVQPPMSTRKQMALNTIPVVVVLAGAYFLISRQGSSIARSSTTKADAVKGTGVGFADVAGCDEAIEDLRDVVNYLADPEHYTGLGAKAPRGVLLEGPPGTGKTLIARAVAGEAGVPFFATSGSDFVNMFVGVGARNVRNLFAKARKHAPAVVFIDEIDGVGKARSGGPSHGGTEERENTLNALLVEMDGFARTDVIVIAATNRADMLDTALTRPGRFDRRVTVPLPDRAGRTRILEVHARDKRVAGDVDFVTLARRTPGASGAQLAALLNEAAIFAAKDAEHTDVITTTHVEQALQTQMLGRERRSALVTDRDRLITAWHEGGHTLAALLQPHADDPVTVSIVPRGQAGGVTWMSGSDRQFLTKAEARAQLVTAMAGRAAEELLLDGDYTTGPSGDLLAATDLALKMVTQYGMGPTLSVFTSDRYAAGGSSAGVDGAVEQLLGEALDGARALLAEHCDRLETLVGWLLEDETVTLDRLEQLRPAGTAEPAAPTA